MQVYSLFIGTNSPLLLLRVFENLSNVFAIGYHTKDVTKAKILFEI